MNDIRISKTTTGNVGEHYVAAELERRNFTTSVVGNNCKDYDIIAINNETHKDVLIQVKASSNKNRWRVNKNKFDKNAKINTDNDNVVVEFSTLEIGKYFKLDSSTIKEIRNYYNLQRLNLNNIKIIINNIKDDYSISANPIKQITYDIEQSGNYTKTMIYQNGNRIMAKPEKI